MSNGSLIWDSYFNALYRALLNVERLDLTFQYDRILKPSLYSSIQKKNASLTRLSETSFSWLCTPCSTHLHSLILLCTSIIFPQNLPSLGNLLETFILLLAGWAESPYILSQSHGEIMYRHWYGTSYLLFQRSWCSSGGVSVQEFSRTGFAGPPKFHLKTFQLTLL